MHVRKMGSQATRTLVMRVPELSYDSRLLIGVGSSDPFSPRKDTYMQKQSSKSMGAEQREAHKKTSGSLLMTLREENGTAAAEQHNANARRAMKEFPAIAKNSLQNRWLA